jgi:hypothetical protein
MVVLVASWDGFRIPIAIAGHPPKAGQSVVDRVL